MTYLIANIAMDTGWAPNTVKHLDPRMFEAVLAIYEDRAKKAKEAKGARRNRGA